ncbi:MAG: thrombospondin type 3 repeat-containing protein [Candidatus Andersenbacteria bacterium]
MSRRLIIILLGILILSIVGGTVYLVIQRLNSTGNQDVANDTGVGSLQEADRGSQQIINPTGDDDNDGLSNADERLWGTSPNNLDTDSDGFLDGDEVQAGHNPTIPGPDDRLPAGFVPGQNLQPLETAPTEPVAVDQFFVSGLDVRLPEKNYTEEYRRAYPENTRTPDTLLTFVQQQPIVTQLPSPTENSIDALPQNGPLVLGEYLEIGGNLAVFSNRTLIVEAINNLLGKNDASLMRSLAEITRLHQASLIQQRVPPAAVSLHRLLLGYTELLAVTYEQAAEYPTDPVKGTVALHQLSQIDQRYYPLIEQEVDRLTSLQKNL